MRKDTPLTAATLAAALSELQRRRAAKRQTFGGGRPASCECGECPKCKRRETMRKYRVAMQKRRAAAK